MGKYFFFAIHGLHEKEHNKGGEREEREKKGM